MDYVKENQRPPLSNPAYTSGIKIDPTRDQSYASTWALLLAGIVVVIVVGLYALDWSGYSNSGTNSLGTPPTATQTTPSPAPTQSSNRG